VETRTLEACLSEHMLFRDLGEETLRVLMECASSVQFEQHELIFRHAQPAERFYMLREGKVSLEIPSPRAGPLTIQTLGKGELLGCSWLFPPYRWHFDARALVPTLAVALDGRRLRSECDADPALGYQLMKRFSQVMHQRMQAARLQIIDLYGPASA